MHSSGPQPSPHGLLPTVFSLGKPPLQRARVGRGPQDTGASVPRKTPDSVACLGDTALAGDPVGRRAAWLKPGEEAPVSTSLQEEWPC